MLWIVLIKIKKQSPLKFVNPEILNTSSDKSEYEEGCLSLPTQFAKVERPSYIEVAYQDENGKKINKKFFWARSNLQHEIDHLNGKLFVDHVSRLKK